MTETEWFACTYPTPMMDFLRGKASGRKFRLFACACWRRAWRCLTNEQDRSTIIFAERLADGLSEVDQLPEAFDEFGRDACPYVCYPPTADAPYHADVAAFMAARAVSDLADDLEMLFANERASQAAMIRDIFGPLAFRDVCFDLNWVWQGGSAAARIAQVVYDERAFDRLPILADALEDAGCDNADILTHCRSEGPHVRGCWVIDLLLEKS